MRTKQQVLEQHGRKCTVQRTVAYQGSTQGNIDVVSTFVGAQQVIAVSVGGRRAHFERIRQVQQDLLHTARIFELMEDLALIERARGALIWELVERPPLHVVRGQLDEFAASARAASLVHGDIRPWNVFFDGTTEKITVIDWSLSYFIGNPRHESHFLDRGHLATPEAEIDAEDIHRMMRVLSGEITTEEAWRHAHHEFNWRPPWIRHPNA